MNVANLEILPAAVLARSGKKKGDEIIFRCPHPERHNNGDQHPSAEYNHSKGAWRCFACGAKGSAVDLARLLGIEVEGALPLDTMLPRGVMKTYQGAPCTAHWVYKDHIGRDLGVVARYDPLDGGRKQIVPYFLSSDGVWSAGIPKMGLLPLYGLGGLSTQPDSPVIVVEGEKCALALQKLMLAAVTSQGGSSSAARSDWTPLAGRDVIIWPDNDEPGQKYAASVSELCVSVGCKSVTIFDITQLSLPPGGDVVDWLALNPTASRSEVSSLLKCQEGPRFTVQRLSFSDIQRLVVPPREEMIVPWLKNKDLVMIYSWRGAGKSYTALSLALALAAGEPFLEWKCPKPKAVLYVDGEMPIESIKERLAKLVVGMQIQPKERLDYIISDVLDRPIPSLATVAGQKIVEEHLVANHYDVLIIDNISTLCRGAEEENSSESWVPMQEWLLKLRRSGLAVILMHHAGKSGAQRGTSSREDVLDTVICLEKPLDYEEGDGARFVFRFQKARSLDGKAIEPIEAKLINGQFGGVTWGIKDVRAEKELRIVTLYTEDKMTTTDIAHELQIHKSTVSRTLKKMGIQIRGK